MNWVFGLLVLVSVVFAKDEEMSLEDKRIENALYAMVGEQPPHDVPNMDTPNLHDLLVNEMKAKQKARENEAKLKKNEHDQSAHDVHSAPENENSTDHKHHHHEHHKKHHDHSAHMDHKDHKGENDALGTHEAHGASHDHGGHMMMMWFHGGYTEVILFDFWRINSWTGLVLSSVAIFAMGALYEGLKWFRVHLTLSKAGCGKDETAPVVPSECGGKRTEGVTAAANEPLVNATSRSVTPEAQHPGPFSITRLSQAGLYILQLILAYWLMLIVMTYNSWLTLAVILGAGFGHWLFAALRSAVPSGEAADSLATDACH